MIAFLRRLLDVSVAPITSNTVDPAEPNYAKERVIKEAVTDLVQAKFAVERRSWEIRQELAGNVLNIVSGDKA